MASAPGLILCLIILSLLRGIELHGEEWIRIGFIILVGLALPAGPSSHSRTAATIVALLYETVNRNRSIAAPYRAY